MPIPLAVMIHAGLWMGLWYWMWFVVPEFKSIFMDFDVELPGPTVLILNIADLLGVVWVSVPLLIVLIVGDAVVDWLLVRHENYRLRLVWFLAGCLVPGLFLSASVTAFDVVMMRFLDGLTGAT
jgi:type II secretory pathway component PulF